MIWKNCNRDGLPNDSQRVLICVGGVYYLAVFDRPKSLFRIEEELLETVFRIGHHDIYWTEVKKTVPDGPEAL
jgi:hypothetical protein